MATIKNQQDLQNAILTLEVQQQKEIDELSGQFKETIERINPANFIKHTFKQINRTQEGQRNLIRTAVMLAVGYIAKRLIDRFMQKDRNHLVKFIGGGLQVAIATWVTKNGMRFQTLIFSVLSGLLKSYTGLFLPQA